MESYAKSFEAAHKKLAVLGIEDLQDMGFSRSMCYEFLHRADLPVVVIGKRRFMHKELFLDWLEQQAKQNKEEN